MIDVHFDLTGSRAATVSGVYQYDTGQRLRLRGLPSQRELSGIDNYIDTLYDDAGNIIPESERIPVVEVHFAHDGDTQAETRLGVWDIDGQYWTADVPDEYLTASASVHAWVTVYHGEVETMEQAVDEETGEPVVDESGAPVMVVTEWRTRARTMYEAVFTPIHRSAPSNTVTDEQEAQWLDKQAAIDDGYDDLEAARKNAVSAAEYAAGIIESLKAEGAAQTAAEAAQAAQAALDAVKAAGGAWENANVVTRNLAAGTEATADVSAGGGTKTLTIGMPKGETGTDGAKGETGPADIELEFDPDTYGLTITTM